MSYRGRHGRGSNRRSESIPRRWERKQAEAAAEREELKRRAQERLGREEVAAGVPSAADEAFVEEKLPVARDPRFDPLDDDTAPFSPADVAAASAAARPARRERGGGHRRDPRSAEAGGWVSARRYASPAEEPGEAPVGRVLSAALTALLLGSLLIGNQLKAGAERMPVGPGRAVARVAVAPVAWLNHVLFIDRAWTGLRAVTSGLTGVTVDAGSPSASAPSGARTTPAAGAVVPAEPPAPVVWTAPSVPTTASPLDVYICGDSMSMDVGAAFVNVSVDSKMLKCERFYRNATGLSRPDAFDWPKHLRSEMAPDTHDAVIAMFGANDGQNVEYQGRVLDLYSPEWKALYAERVGAVMDILAAGDTRVYWVGLPIPRKPAHAKKFRLMNDVYAAEAAERPNVVYIDSWKLFSDSSGKYAELLKNDQGKLVDMRKDDGIHFTMAGAKRMAQAVLAKFAEDWGVPGP